MSQFPRRISGPIPKPSRTARKQAKKTVRTKSVTKEAKHKAESRRRDGYRCRFPLCLCNLLNLPLESSHDRHKGSGGNPTGDRSLPHLMITLCQHRHQDSIISRHKGTLRTRYLTNKGNDGPVAWEIDVEAFTRAVAQVPAFSLGEDGFIEVARERKVQVLEPLKAWQRDVLTILSKMTV